MVGQRVLTAATVDRRAFLALGLAGGLAAAGGARLHGAAAAATPWDPRAWADLVGSRLELAEGGAVRLLELVDRTARPGTGRFSLLLSPLADGVGEGLHTVLHPSLGRVELGATSVGRSGRLLVVVDRTSTPTREHRHG